MPRNPIYPEVKNFIILKKRAKLEKVKSDSKKESSTTQTPKRTSTKRKDAPTVTIAKKSAKRSRQANTSAVSSSKISSLEKVKDISAFIRDVLFKAQLFVNFFILQHPTKLTNDFFDKFFWGRADEERPEDQNLDVVQLTSSFVELSATSNGSLTKYSNAKVGCIKNLALRHILEKYDDIYKAQATQKDKTDSMKSLLPRRFSLFPNPTLHWRFIKIDAQNLTGIFSDAKQKKQANESSFDHQQRCFYQMFAFKRLGIQSCEKLQALPEQKGKMVPNGLYTDGYTHRVLFARKVLPSPPEDNICLELNDLSSEEANKHFRPCTVDPGRRDPFVSYHGGTDIRRLSSIEYYNMGGSVTRMKEQQKHKHRLGIEKIETDIPSPKTASIEQFVCI
ncbi:hypothetical protein MFLAVUS_004388 [Mucor flavus]|uniref:Uncharacterized protein n=1 Tax=Mucor flavus TaxID=439312 RepID=A0ABP9YVS9_9FUNG